MLAGDKCRTSLLSHSPLGFVIMAGALGSDTKRRTAWPGTRESQVHGLLVMPRNSIRNRDRGVGLFSLLTPQSCRYRPVASGLVFEEDLLVVSV